MSMDEFGVPPPLDANSVGPWENHDGQIQRYFHGTRRGHQIPVEIVGFQDADGAVVARMIRVGHDRTELDIPAVHELIWALADASNEAERLTHIWSEFEDEFYADLLGDVDSG